MRDYPVLLPLARVALAPLLIAQGLAVRARTPPIPEALGDHSGRVGCGPPLRVLFIGDSSMAGVGADHLDQALPGQVRQALAPYYDVRWHMHARSSATTRSTLRSLPPHPCDIAVLALGVNDVTGMVPLRRWMDQTTALVDGLIKRGARAVHLSAVPPMQRFPALPQPLAWLLGAQAERMNAALRAFAAEVPEVTLHTLPDIDFSPGHVARDGFHPGPETYRLWGALIAEAILSTPGNRPGV
ncbi:MAG: SGNH/GDSL hydrolase family protein [Pseudomonadota bacterium]